MQGLGPVHLRPAQGAQRDRHQVKIDSGVQPGRGEQVGDQGPGPLRLPDQQRLQVLPVVGGQLITVV